MGNGGGKKAGGSKGTRKAGSKGGSGKRELIDTGTDKRYVKRGAGGEFKESDDVGKSLAADVRKSAKTKVKPGYGDQGDQPSKKGGAKKGGAKKAAGKKASKKSASKKG